MSSFTWLDYSEHERQRAMEIVDLLGEDDTRDELGLGTIRDALADLLFPGTSTIQTRARYFLFVPWIYLELERKRVSSSASADAARSMQGKLCQALREGQETDGVIGFRAGLHVRRLPGEVYWSGMRRWDIFKSGGSEADYRRSLDNFHRSSDPISRPDAGETPDRPRANWDAHLPRPPEDWLSEATFELSKAEASYLHHRIRQTSGRSLLAFLLENGQTVADGADFPWDAEVTDATLVGQLGHVQNFSQLMHGAALLYNLLLSREKPGGQYIEVYIERLEQWRDGLVARHEELRLWRHQAFWNLVEHDLMARVRPGTKLFVNRWIDIAMSGAPIDSEVAARLVREQEQAVKPGRARLGDPRAVENWGGASGAAQLDFRWNRPVRAMVNDILAGLNNA